MSRRKKTTASTFKNPLAQTFGLALWELRREVGISSDEMAEALELAPSTYRLVEAGGVVMQPYALGLVKRIGRVEWYRVVLLLEAIQLLEKAKSSVQEMRRKAEDVQLLESDLFALMSKFDPIWEALEQKAESSEISQMIIDNRLHERMIQYMCTPLPSRAADSEETTAWAKILVENTPPIYVDIFVDTMRRLSGFLPSVSIRGLMGWEQEHAGKFACIYGMVKSSRILSLSVKDENFDWSYVWRRDFKGVYILSFDSKDKTSKEEEKLKHSLKDRVNSSTSSSENNTEPRVYIKSVEEIGNEVSQEAKGFMYYDLITDATAKELNKKYVIELSNIWVYQLLEGKRSIAFIDDKKAESEDGLYFSRTCSYDQTELFLRFFKKVWDN